MERKLALSEGNERRENRKKECVKLLAVVATTILYVGKKSEEMSNFMEDAATLPIH